MVAGDDVFDMSFNSLLRDQIYEAWVWMVEDRLVKSFQFPLAGSDRDKYVTATDEEALTFNSLLRDQLLGASLRKLKNQALQTFNSLLRDQ